MTEEVKTILNELSLEEKIALCSGKDFWHTEAVNCAELPEVMMCDGPHGLRKQDEKSDHLGINESIKTVCYPSASALAASFDLDVLFELGDALSNVIVKPNKITPKVGYARNKNLNLALKTTKNIDLKKVLFFYFNTTMSVKASLDELFRLLNMYHDVQPGELIRELQSFPIWVKATGIEQGKSNNITTENYLKIEPQIEVGNVILMSIVDYDYVLKEFVAKPYTGSIF